ncbi:MAG: divalent-cation tolerance protein CutA [Firmicutes bacterium]|nr:divalent-cation tolerance protein CutA [Bacillota bacterium]
MNKYIEVKTTFETHEATVEFATKILEAKLVACTHVSEIKSHYVFEGQVCNHIEFQLGMITRANLYKKCEEFIKSNHPYRIPQIIAIQIKFGHPDYLDWVDKSCITSD